MKMRIVFLDFYWSCRWSKGKSIIHIAIDINEVANICFPFLIQISSVIR